MKGKKIKERNNCRLTERKKINKTIYIYIYNFEEKTLQKKMNKEIYMENSESR